MRGCRRFCWKQIKTCSQTSKITSNHKNGQLSLVILVLLPSFVGHMHQPRCLLKKYCSVCSYIRNSNSWCPEINMLYEFHQLTSGVVSPILVHVTNTLITFWDIIIDIRGYSASLPIRINWGCLVLFLIIFAVAHTRKFLVSWPGMRFRNHNILKSPNVSNWYQRMESWEWSSRYNIMETGRSQIPNWFSQRRHPS